MSAYRFTKFPRHLAIPSILLISLSAGAGAAPGPGPRTSELAPSSETSLIVVPRFDTGHSPVIGTVPVTAVFTNTTVGDAVSFTWDYGDGTTETVPDTRQVTHIYTGPNIYHVSLSATDSNGDVFTTSEENNVFARPTGGTYFVDVTASSGTSAVHQKHPQNLLDVSGSGVAWCDVNGDTNLDLMVSNNGGANWLFINSGPPDYTFADEAAPRGVDDPEGMSAGVVCVDYDNDADKDLFVQNFAPAWAPNLPKDRLFRNDGAGNFVDVAEAAGLADTGATGRPPPGATTTKTACSTSMSFSTPIRLAPAFPPLAAPKTGSTIKTRITLSAT